MFRRLVLAGLMAALTPAVAAEHGGGEGAKAGKPGTNVDMPYLMAPLTENGRLAGYAYVSTRLTAASDAFALTVRDRLAFIQDAFVRDVNARGVAAADDPRHVDIPALEKRLSADAARVLGPGKVSHITVCTVQIAELRTDRTPAAPSEFEAQVTDAHGNPVKSRCAVEKAE